MRAAILLSAVVVICFLVTQKLLDRKGNNEIQEPPSIPSKIPIIGHIWGMVRHKADYYRLLRDRYSLPIGTIALFGSRIYLVNSVSTIISIQKHTKSLAFQPIQAKFSTRICGTSKDAYKILLKAMDLENGTYGDIFRAMHPPLAPGKSLDAMTRVMIASISKSVEALRPQDGPTTVGLVSWLRHHVTLATTDAVYGPASPFRNKTIEEAFWAFEQEIPRLIFLPTWLASRGVKNRNILIDAFLEYFEKGSHEEGSALVRDFYTTQKAYGFSLRDSAAFETGNAIAVLANTSAAVFWMVFYVFSRLEVLIDIREEIETIVNTVEEETGERTYHVDFTKINTHCPILASTFREVMRLRSIGTSLRQVVKDTVLEDCHLLKKDGIILMPTVSIHTDAHVWGSDVEDFKYKRFVENKKVSPSAFRTFGGGATLCPGRHFSTMEVLAATIMMVLRYDIAPVGEGGWLAPSVEKTNMASVVLEPDYDIEIEVKKREGWREGEYVYHMTDSEAIFAVAAEDAMEEKRSEKL